MDDQGVFWQITVKAPGEEAVIVDTVNIDGDSFTAGSSTFRYDANDTFQYLGAAITFASSSKRSRTAIALGSGMRQTQREARRSTSPGISAAKRRTLPGPPGARAAAVGTPL